MMAAIAVVFSGCEKDDDAEKQAQVDEQIILDYLEANNLNATKHESGLYYIITNQGNGENPTINSTVEAFYEGYFTDGSIFDRTVGAPATFSLANLITGWQYGIPLIKEGGSITLFIPSALGYGTRGSGSVPPNTVIIFDIDLVAIL
jgi:FKBP-type peptidyl-prolyl cis-trans isomerase FkpA